MLSRRSIGLLGVLILIPGLSDAVRAQSDQLIYGDSLVGGWQDWSWCARDLGSTDAVHSGTRSVKVTYTAAYQGFYLRHTSFDSALYTALTFWINGGGSNGRSINVAAQLNDTSQSSVSLNRYVESGGVVAGAWRKVTIPLSDLGVNNAANLNGFWLQESSGSAQPAFYVDDLSLAAAPAPLLVNVNVDANNVKRTVDTRVFGVAAAIWDSQFATPSTISLLAANRTRITRFPGGSLSNNYHWSSNTTDNNTWQWATGFDEFASVARAINAQAFISVNYGTGTAQEAADWVRYSNIIRGYGFKFWEIGNENYGSWETDTHERPHDAYSYATLARDYIIAMKAVDPTIKVGVVVNTGENSYANYSDHPALNSRTGQTHNGWTPVLLSTMRSLGVTPDFVIYHKYEQQPGQEDDSTLLQSARTWVSDAADLRRQLNDYLGAQAANIEIVATENNSVSSRPGKQTTSLVNGLYYADSIGQVLQTEFNAFTWWIFRNGRETNNNNSDLLYGWRQYGDYGMVSGDNEPYPAFYLSKLVSNYLAAGGDQVVSATSDHALLSAYAVKRESGELSLMVINKSRTSSLNVRISFMGIVPQPNAAIYSYGIPQDEAARTGMGSTDIATSAFDGAASSFNYTFAPYSATVITLAAGGSCAFSVEAQFGKFKSGGGSGDFSVTSDAQCAWQASSNANWITITGGDVGIGNGVVTIAVAPNTTGRKRKGRVTIAGQVFKVTQKG